MGNANKCKFAGVAKRPIPEETCLSKAATARDMPHKKPAYPTRADGSPDVGSYARDALTGAPLAPGNAYMRWRPITSTESEEPPLRIDSSRPYPVDGEGDYEQVRARDGYAGGLAWGADFTRYIGNALPVRIREALRVWGDWWDIPAVRLAVAAEFGVELAEAVIALERGAEGVHSIAGRLRHTTHWVGIRAARVRRYVRGEWLPHDYLKNAGLLAYRLSLPQFPRYTPQSSEQPRYGHAGPRRKAAS